MPNNIKLIYLYKLLIKICLFNSEEIPKIPISTPDIIDSKDNIKSFKHLNIILYTIYKYKDDNFPKPIQQDIF